MKVAAFLALGLVATATAQNTVMTGVTVAEGQFSTDGRYQYTNGAWVNVAGATTVTGVTEGQFSGDGRFQYISGEWVQVSGAGATTAVTFTEGQFSNNGLLQYISGEWVRVGATTGQFSMDGRFQNIGGEWVQVSGAGATPAVTGFTEGQFSNDGLRQYIGGEWVRVSGAGTNGVVTTTPTTTGSCASRCVASTTVLTQPVVTTLLAPVSTTPTLTLTVPSSGRRLFQTAIGCGVDQTVVFPYCISGQSYTQAQLGALVGVASSTPTQCSCQASCIATSTCCFDYQSVCGVIEAQQPQDILTITNTVFVERERPVYNFVNSPFAVPVVLNVPFEVPVNVPEPWAFDVVTRVVPNNVPVFNDKVVNVPVPVGFPVPVDVPYDEFYPIETFVNVPEYVYQDLITTVLVPVPVGSDTPVPVTRQVRVDVPVPTGVEYPKGEIVNVPYAIPVPVGVNVFRPVPAPVPFEKIAYYPEVYNIPVNVNRPYSVNVPVTVDHPVNVQGAVIGRTVYNPVNFPVPLYTSVVEDEETYLGVRTPNYIYTINPIPEGRPVPGQVVEVLMPYINEVPVFVNYPVRVPVFFETVIDVPFITYKDVFTTTTIYTNLPYEVITEVNVGNIGNVGAVFNPSDGSTQNSIINSCPTLPPGWTCDSNGNLVPPNGFEIINGRIVARA